jgi:CYTH domain-containing protein
MNKNGIEIERKFLLKSLDPASKEFYVDSTNILQFYLSSDEGISRRVREESSMDDSKVVFTYTEKKDVSPGVREENEKEITSEEFENLYKEASTYITKSRHKFKFPETGDLIWEIDVFRNVTLIIAEIELPSIDHSFEIPALLRDNIVMEITEHPEFNNINLATIFKGFDA